MKALKRTALVLFIVCTSCTQEKENQNPTKKPQLYYSKVHYTAPSKIIKHPGRLTGDKKAIFCHPYFLKLTSTEMDNLGPYVVEKEFAKLGINLTEGERFINAYLFFKTYYLGHKKLYELWKYYKDLAPYLDKIEEIEKQQKQV